MSTTVRLALVLAALATLAEPARAADPHGDPDGAPAAPPTTRAQAAPDIGPRSARPLRPRHPQLAPHAASGGPRPLRSDPSAEQLGPYRYGISQPRLDGVLGALRRQLQDHAGEGPVLHDAVQPPRFRDIGLEDADRIQTIAGQKVTGPAALDALESHLVAPVKVPVVVERAGKRMKLTWEVRASRWEARHLEAVKAAFTRISATRVRVDRGAYARVRSSSMLVNVSVRWEPPSKAEEAAGLQGLWARAVRDGGFYQGAGLRPGDLLTAVNDAPALSPRVIMDAFGPAKTLGDTTLSVLRAGKPLRIELHVTGELPPPPPPDPEKVAERERLDKAIVARPDGVVRIDAAFWRGVLDAPETLTRQVRLVPAGSGAPYTLRLAAIRPDSVPARLGFRDGDTLTAIGGVAVSTLIRDPSAWKPLLTATELTAEVVREGSPLTVRFVVE